MSFQKKINQQGFLLIDVLIAIFVLITVIILGVIIINTGKDMSTMVSSEITAVFLIQEKTEELRNIRDNNLAAVPPRLWSNNFIGEREIDHIIPLDGIEFARNTSVVIIAPDSFADIRITIEWFQGGRLHQIETRKRLYNLTPP